MIRIYRFAAGFANFAATLSEILFRIYQIQIKNRKIKAKTAHQQNLKTKTKAMFIQSLANFFYFIKDGLHRVFIGILKIGRHETRNVTPLSPQENHPAQLVLKKPPIKGSNNTLNVQATSNEHPIPTAVAIIIPNPISDQISQTASHTEEVLSLAGSPPLSTVSARRHSVLEKEAALMERLSRPSPRETVDHETYTADVKHHFSLAINTIKIYLKLENTTIDEIIINGTFFSFLKLAFLKEIVWIGPYRISDKTVLDENAVEANKILIDELFQKLYCNDKMQDFHLLKDELLHETDKQVFEKAFANGLYLNFINRHFFRLENENTDFQPVEMISNFIHLANLFLLNKFKIVREGLLHKQTLSIPYDALRDDINFLQITLPESIKFFLLSSKTLTFELFTQYKKCYHDKFSREINQMKRIGIEEGFIDRAIGKGLFYALLWTWIQSKEKTKSYEDNIWDLTSSLCTPLWAIENALEYLEKYKKVSILDFPFRLELIYNSPIKIDEMVNFFKKKPNILQEAGFYRSYKPSSDLVMDDIKEIFLIEASIECVHRPYYLTIEMNDGRVLKECIPCADAAYIASENPDLIPGCKQVVTERYDDYQEYYNIFNTPSRVWTWKHVLEIIKNSLYIYPPGFEGIIGTHIDRLEDDIDMLFTSRTSASESNSMPSRGWDCMCYSLEDYVNYVMRGQSFFVSELQESGLNIEEIKEATRNGNFFLLLRLSRFYSREEIRTRYKEIASEDTLKKTFMKKYLKHQKDLYGESLEKRIPVRGKEEPYLRIVEDRRFKLYVERGLYLNYFNINGTNNEILSFYLAKNHYLVSIPKDDLPSLGLAAILQSQKRLTKEELDDLLSRYLSEDSADPVKLKEIFKKINQLIESDLNEWEEIADGKYPKNGWAYRSTVDSIKSGKWPTLREYFFRSNNKSARKSSEIVDY